MKQYEKPVMNVLALEAEDVITLSVGGSDYDPTINKDNNNPSDNPWAN